ncbi:hypothetical protein [Lentzea sp. NPDC059081]|uniref:hypothetical protein n=1 Tax=Lentzea sp. NPDC059081 TaxID=3346719 RepID=UPI0036BE95BF
MECWFCGRTAGHRWHDRAVGLHKGVDTSLTPWIVLIRTTWQREVVLVPRCARCHRGHLVEQLAMVLALAAPIAYAASGGLDVLLGINPGSKAVAAVWAGAALVPALGWVAIRQAWLPLDLLAPRRLRYARRHPAVVRLREEDDWRFRPGPFPYWGFPEGTVPPPPSTGARRTAGRVLALLGFTCFVATVVVYFRGNSELAGGLIVATAGLFYLASKADPKA